jgi:hypothetical protein
MVRRTRRNVVVDTRRPMDRRGVIGQYVRVVPGDVLVSLQDVVLTSDVPMITSGSVLLKYIDSTFVVEKGSFLVTIATIERYLATYVCVMSTDGKIGWAYVPSNCADPFKTFKLIVS